jgi:ribosomal protein L24E
MVTTAFALLLAQVLAPLASFHGRVESIGKGKLALEVENENTMVFFTSRKTKYQDGDKPAKPTAIKPGTRVVVEGRRGMDGELEAVLVRIEKPRIEKQQ